MCTNGTSDATIITGTSRKPTSTIIRKVVMVHPTTRITIQATWYQRDCRAWKATRGERSLYISQITNAPTGPRKPVKRFRKTERCASADQVSSSLDPIVVVPPGPETRPDLTGPDSTP